MKHVFLRIAGYPSLIRRLQAPVLIRMLAPKNNESILDLGCGNGIFTYEFSEKCDNICGLDQSINNDLALAAHFSPSISLIKGNVQYLPFKERTFDKILLSSILQMIDDDKKLLYECLRVLKDDGLLIVSVPLDYVYIKNLNKIKSDLNIKFGSTGKGFYRKQDIGFLLETTGFEIIEVEYAPKRWGSFVYELWLYLCYRSGFPLFHSAYFFLLYPIAYCDRFEKKDKTGCEIIIKAKRITIP